jgi:hypothetical protein
MFVSQNLTNENYFSASRYEDGAISIMFHEIFPIT